MSMAILAATAVLGTVAYSLSLEKTREDSYIELERKKSLSENQKEALAGKQPLTSFGASFLTRQDARNNDVLKKETLVEMNGLFGKTKYAYMNPDTPWCGVGEMYRKPFAL